MSPAAPASRSTSSTTFTTRIRGSGHIPPPLKIDCGKPFQRRHRRWRTPSPLRTAPVSLLAHCQESPMARRCSGGSDGSRRHPEPLRRRLLAGDDDDAAPTSQAVVGDPQQGVRVGRQIHAHERRLLVQHVVDEAGILVAEAVMLLPPDMRGEQTTRSRRSAGAMRPGGFRAICRCWLNIRIDDVDERLVAVEQPVAAGEQIALQPALAGAFDRILPSRGRRADRSFTRYAAGKASRRCGR